MDKDLIVGLSNLSESLDRIADALSKKGESKTATGAAMQMGEFDKQIREISSSITEVKKDTQKLLDQQDTILKILKKKEKDSKVESKKDKVKDIPQESTPVKVGRDKKSEKDDVDRDGKSKKISTGKTSTEEVSKEKKTEKKPGFFGDMDTKKIKDGISSVLLIAVGIIAIGMALKLVGKVDFVSVMALALALPLIAFAFGKIAAVFSGQTVEDEKGRKVKTEKLNVRDIPSVILSMVGFSTAILVSSYILSKVKPIGLFQAMTSILIAGTFAVIAPSLGKMMRGFSGLSLMTMVKSIIFLPLVLLGISTAIMLSSYVLSKVKPIGLFQAMTAILIAGTFAVVSYGLGKLLGAFKGIHPLDALVASTLMPIVLLGISTAIMLSSYVLSKVKPIGLFQALSSILIAATFAVISYGIGKIISAFKGINPVAAIAAAIIMPILFVALSLSIMVSSAFLSKVRPIGLFQALTSIFIAATFVVLSYAVAKILPAFRRINYQDALKASIMMPLLFTGMSIAIMLSSYPLSKVRPIGLFQFLTGIGIAILFVAFAFAMKIIVKAIKDIKKDDVISSFVKLTIMALAIAVTGFIISEMPDISLAKTLKAIVFTGGLLAISYIFKSIIKATDKFKERDLFSTGVKLTIMASTIALTGYIISKMSDISLLKTLTAIVFTGGLVAISYLFKGIIKATDGMSSTGLVKTAIKLGLIIGAIVAAGYLVNKMPSINIVRVLQFTALSIALSLVTIIMAGVVKVLDKVGLSSIIKGGIAIVALAGVIMISSILLSKGRYEKYPNYKWSLSVALSLGIFGGAAFLLGTQAMNPMFYAGMGIIIALSGVIVIASFVLSKGKYNKYPTPSWSLGVGMSLAFFGVGAVLLGTQVFNPFFYAGLGMILVVAASVVATSYILDAGKYDKYPSFGWVGPTILVLGAFGVVAVALGLVSPLLLLGLPAMLGVAGTIYLVDKMFSSGSYNKYPTKDWVNPSISLIGRFAGMAILYSFALPLIILGGLSILAVAGTILLIDKIFGKGSFKSYPSTKWMNGVSNTLEVFSKLLKDIRRDLGFGDLILGAIKVLGVVYTIKQMDEVLGKGDFKKFPSKSWNDGVGYSIRTFMDLMKEKSFWDVIGEKIGSFFGGGLDDIATGMVKIDTILSKGKFDKYPSSDWTKNVINTIRSFKNLMGESGMFEKIGSGISDFISGGDEGSLSLVGIADQIQRVSYTLSIGNYDKYPSESWTKSIQSIFVKFLSLGNLASKSTFGISSILNLTKSILIIDSLFGKGKFDKYPDPKWIRNSSNAILEYGKLIILSDKIFPLSNLMMGIIKDRLIVENILWFDKKLSLGKYQKYPNSKWLTETSNSILYYGRLFIKSNKEFSLPSLLLGIMKVNLITDSIISIDKKIEAGKYQRYPNKSWIDKTSSSILESGKLSINVDKKFGLISLILGLSKIRKIADTIQQVSLSLSRGNYTKFPSNQWSLGVPGAIKGFMSFNFGILSGILLPDKVEKNELGKIVDLMLFVDKKFQSGNWQKFPSVQWVNGTILSLQKFRSIISLLSFSSLGDGVLSSFGSNNPIVTAVSNIEKLAVSFEKLSKSIKSFTDSIKNIDGEKLSAIRSLSTNVIMMSLMDPAQFDIMMDKLEKRSGVFGDLVKDFEAKKSEVNKTSGGIGVSYKTSKNTTGTSKTESQILSEKLDLMNSFLADITSVVGSRGTLKNYLNRIKDDVSIGSQNTLSQRSDKRVKNIIKKVGVSDNGINIYLFTYHFDPSTIYQGIIAQELIGGKYEKALHVDKSGLYSVDYSIIDVEFKKTNL